MNFLRTSLVGEVYRTQNLSPVISFKASNIFPPWFEEQKANVYYNISALICTGGIGREVEEMDHNRGAQSCLLAHL